MAGSVVGSCCKLDTLVTKKKKNNSLFQSLAVSLATLSISNELIIGCGLGTDADIKVRREHCVLSRRFMHIFLPTCIRRPSLRNEPPSQGLAGLENMSSPLIRRAKPLSGAAVKQLTRSGLLLLPRITTPQNRTRHRSMIMACLLTETAYLHILRVFGQQS